MPEGERPIIPKNGAIPTDPDLFPDRIEYDAATSRLKIGDGYIDNVSRAVWEYEVSDKQVLVQWFSYRRLDRSRPIIGDRRPATAVAARKNSTRRLDGRVHHGTDERASRPRSPGRP